VSSAESLFQEARKLIEAKRYDEACPKLLESHTLAPAVGTLLNLADCYEHAGKLASAWTRFREGVALAQKNNRPDRERTARSRAEKLEPQLIRLTIRAADANVEIKLDDATIDRASPVPVDPGTHTLLVTANGKKPYSTTLSLAPNVRAPSIDVPALANIPTTAGVLEPTERAEEPKVSRSAAVRTLGFVTVGVGVGGVALGTVFALRASSKSASAKDHCNGLQCDTLGVAFASQAKNAGTVSTISFIAGGLFIVGGAFLVLTTPRAPMAKGVTVSVGPANLLVDGVF
jgi:hypothetical protein